MSLRICPDCRHEVSSEAIACPNCGRPFDSPVIERTDVVVAAEAPARRDDFPKWVVIPLGVLGIVVLLFLFFFVRSDQDDTANTSINVNVARKQTVDPAQTNIRTDPNQVVIPPSETTAIPPSDTTSIPPSSTTVAPPRDVTSLPPSSQSSSRTTIPSDNINPASDKGTVVIEAKVMTRNAGLQSVRNEKFYLLKKDLETILSEADIEDETGQGLTNAFGLSVLYPDRYREINTKALNAIKKNIVYTTTTDSAGKAQMRDVKPNSYYLFGITKTGKGFAIWSSPVVITPGQNVLELSPPSVTEAQYD